MRPNGAARGVRRAGGVLAYPAALAGDEERCRRLCDEALGGAVVVMQGALWVDWARGVLDLVEPKGSTPRFSRWPAAYGQSECRARR